MDCLHQALSHFYICQRKAQKPEEVHIRLVCRVLLWCLISRKGLLQQQEKQDNLRWLYWAPCKALAFPKSFVEMELPLPKYFSFAHSGSCRTTSRQFHHFIETAVSLTCCCWKSTNADLQVKARNHCQEFGKLLMCEQLYPQYSHLLS